MNSGHALIIDDNQRNVQVLVNLLSDEHFTSTQVTHPSHLESAIGNIEKVDVVFLDLEMPGLDGYEVHQMLRADERFENVPIVACTVHLGEMHTASQVGFSGFLGKPLNADVFPEQLSRIIRGEAVWAT